MSGARETTLTRWGPQVAGWVVAALVGLGVYQSRIAVLERADVEHDRRLQSLEQGREELNRTLSRIGNVLERLEASTHTERGR